jgi:hypothetical protein
MTSGSWRSAERSAVAKSRVSDVDLALVDDRLLVAVEELDRVLDGDDVLGALAVDQSIIAASVVDLPEPVVPVHSTRPRALLADPLEHRRQHQLAGGQDAGRDDAQHQPHRAPLLEDVAAEPAEPGHRVGDVDLELLLEALLLAGVHDRERHRDGVLLHQPLELGERLPTFAARRRPGSPDGCPP